MTAVPASPQGFVERLAGIVGPAHVLTTDNDTAPFLTDWRRNYSGRALAVVMPGSTEEVAQVVCLCAATRTPVVPQGGNTGLVGGATPDAGGRSIVLSTRRLNRIRALDTDNNTLTVEAGAILQTVQEAARAAGRLFPLSLAAEGSCTVGGNLSTNAGGTNVLRYGNARDLVLGLEAVLPDGRVWHGLKGLRKDNTGYDLKHLLMGAEGTLGLITAATLKLFPLPQARLTALVAVNSPGDAVALLSALRSELGDRVSGFELISRHCLDLVVKHFPATVEPFAAAHPWQVLVQVEDTWRDAPLPSLFERALEPVLEQGIARDAIVSQSGAQARALWTMREHIPEGERLEGKSVKHDISVPVSRIADFIARGDAQLAAAFPAAQVVCFGHLGDGNLHYNLAFPGAVPTPEQAARANQLVYALVDELDGSISAEHGLGQLKREEITLHKSAVALQAMRAIKGALDPLGIMNPGKVL
ncbi:MAG: FAD-binding oxidoreductase [Betaproteobacteria bacterium]|nr:FAD-binding oxidoreductase [Betaproteobacteria bacterium]